MIRLVIARRPNQLQNRLPNVKITVTWNNGGGVDVYYGYVSYSQRLALTDGIAVTDGVKEVWLS